MKQNDQHSNIRSLTPKSSFLVDSIRTRIVGKHDCTKDIRGRLDTRREFLRGMKLRSTIVLSFTVRY